MSLPMFLSRRTTNISKMPDKNPRESAISLVKINKDAVEAIYTTEFMSRVLVSPASAAPSFLPSGPLSSAPFSS